MTQRYERHGLTGTRIESIWHNMIRRCYKQNSSEWHRYGARGIAVCKRWRDSIRVFYDDVGDPPSKRHSLERLDNSKGYSRNNCVWATREQQCNNTRRNRIIAWGDRSLTASEWSKITGIHVNTIYHRHDAGLPPALIFDPTPKHMNKGRRRTWVVGKPDGTELTITNLAEFCRKNNLVPANMIGMATGSNHNKSHRGGWTCRYP